MSRGVHPQRRNRIDRFALLLFFLALTGYLGSPLLFADSNDDRHKKIRKQIDSLESSLATTEQKKDKFTKDLKKIELDLSEASNALRAIQDKLAEQTSKLSQHHTRQNQLRQEVTRQKGLLMGQIKTAYLLGPQDPLKILLSQQDPQGFDRTLIYYSYFNKARLSQWEAIQKQEKTLSELTITLEAVQEELESHYKSQEIRQQKLADLQHTRHQVLSEMDRDISSQQTTLAQLKSDEKSLKNLLDSLPASPPTDAADIKNEEGEEPSESRISASSPKAGLAAKRGSLPWPISGKILSSYGSNQQRYLKGTIIAAPEGTAIRAIAAGQVVYADWMRGYGLLLIVDHGAGYMSLYGYTRSLEKSVGDTVNAGETIAYVGDSGGQLQTALYFAIRYQRKPQDPAQWCQRIRGNRVG